MGKKIFIAIAVIVGVAVYLTIREQGVDEAFGGALAPVDTVRNDAPSDPLGLVTGQSVPTVSQSNYKQMVDRTRERVNDAMAQSVERSSR